MKKLFFTFLLLLNTFSYLSMAQNNDADKLLEESTGNTTNYATAGFKTTRVINGHSFENIGGGVLDTKISHRFGFFSAGPYELYGLDQATIRLGLDYGINNRLMIGAGRSSYEKTIDGYVKYKLLRQSTGKKNTPVTLSLFAATALKTNHYDDLARTNYFSSRLYYTYQLIAGRKFSDEFSFQLTPTLVHRNLIDSVQYKNDVFALGAAARIKLTRRIALCGEYYYVLPDQISKTYHNSAAIGFDIETGGHVFQLHFTNSTAMNEKGFITETTGDFLKGDIHFGFNISRVFTIYNKEYRNIMKQKKQN